VSWITAALLADASAALVEQRVLGCLTWLLLITLLRSEGTPIRVQVTVAVCVATVAEVTGSGLLQVYTYRLGNIPSYVLPGHGLIYLAALAFGRSRLAERHASQIRWTAVIVCGAWAAWGAALSPRPDVLGAALFVVFACCMFAWRSPAVYAGAFAITTHLELLGVAVGNWTWAEHAGWFSAGNPPSAVVAGYCVIDWVALTAGAAVCMRRSSQAPTMISMENASNARATPASAILLR
jgi:hypothetical protein